MAKNKPKEEQTEIPMEGPGVAPVKDKKLDKLLSELRDYRDQSAEIAEKRGETEVKALERMIEIGVTDYRWDDQIAKIKAGKDHIKIKMVKADGDNDGSEGEPGEE